MLSCFPSNSFSTSQHKFILTMPKPGSGTELFIVQAKPVLVAVSACNYRALPCPGRGFTQCPLQFMQVQLLSFCANKAPATRWWWLKYCRAGKEDLILFSLERKQTHLKGFTQKACSAHEWIDLPVCLIEQWATQLGIWLLWFREILCLIILIGQRATSERCTCVLPAPGCVKNCVLLRHTSFNKITHFAGIFSSETFWWVQLLAQ